MIQFGGRARLPTNEVAGGSSYRSSSVAAQWGLRLKSVQVLTQSKIEWDLTNGPLSKLLELLDTQVFSGSVQWVLLETSWIDRMTPGSVL